MSDTTIAGGWIFMTPFEKEMISEIKFRTACCGGPDMKNIADNAIQFISFIPDTLPAPDIRAHPNVPSLSIRWIFGPMRLKFSIYHNKKINIYTRRMDSQSSVDTSIQSSLIEECFDTFIHDVTLLFNVSRDTDFSGVWPDRL